MHELIIKLTGTVQDFNFDEWKQALIRQIQATAKELHSDEDFIIADRQAKQRVARMERSGIRGSGIPHYAAASCGLHYCTTAKPNAQCRKVSVQTPP
jgi:hypothetical protein